LGARRREKEFPRPVIMGDPSSLKAAREHLTAAREHLTATREYLKEIRRSLAAVRCALRLAGSRAFSLHACHVI